MSQILKLTHENQQLKRQINQYQQVLGVSPYVDDSLFKGGYRVVKTIADRDAIKCCWRKQGMKVLVIGEDLSFKEYILKTDDCKENTWEEISVTVEENEVFLIEDYSELSEDLITQRDLNLILKQLILNLQTQIDNVELTDEKVQITEATNFAQIGQNQKDFNKNVSDYKASSDLKNQEQDDRISDIEGENTSQNDLINNLQTTLNGKLDKGTYSGTAQDLKNDIDGIQIGGRNLIINSTNDDTILLYGATATRENIVYTTLPSKNYFKFTSVVRTIGNYVFYIPSFNDPDKISQSLIGKKIQISFHIRSNNSQKLVFDRDGNQNFMIDNTWQKVRFNTVFNSGNLHFFLEGSGLTSFDISSVKIEFGDKATDWTPAPEDIQTTLDSKLNKPTTTSNTASYPFVVGEDGNGNSARLPAGDLGKNFFNSDLSNTTARNHKMNAGVTVNTLGNPHILSGLPNKNTDITNFRKVRVQNTSGLDAVVDSKNLLTDGVTSMTDAEKDAWRLAQLKTNETYSTGQPRVDLISPININKTYNYTQYVSVIGLNLYINTGASIVKLVRVKDENGVNITPEETLINASDIQTFSTNFQILVLGINFFGKAKGYYKIYITSFTGLTNLTSPEFLVQENFNTSNFNPVSFSVIDKYTNSADYVTSSEIYHITQQYGGNGTLEKAVKSNVLFNFQNGFLYDFNFEMYLTGSYTNSSFNCGFSNEDFDITNGYTPQAYLGIGGEYGHIFINSVQYKNHLQTRGQPINIRCIFFNKNGVTTIIQLASNGVVLVSSMVQNYNVGDNIRFYANFYSCNSGHGTALGQNFKIKLPSTYQSF